MTRTHRLTIAERLRQGAGHEPADIMAAEKTMDEAAAEIERLQGHMRALADTSVARDTAGIFKGLWQGSERECEELRAEIERLKALLRRHQVAAWCEEDSDLAVETRAAIGEQPKP